MVAIVDNYGLIIKKLLPALVDGSEIFMVNDKVYSQPEKEAIRIQLLASMLANSNSNFSQKPCSALQDFWQILFKRTKPLN